jgi:tRNA pseudouridine65 synthase
VNPPPASLSVLYQDAHYVLIDKPAGLLMHRSPISRDRAFVLQTLRDQLGRWVYPVHRLDRATSGVLAFGLTAHAAQRLAAEFAARRVGKTYLAVARGWTDPQGCIDHPVADEDSNGVHQAAQTRYRRIGTVELPVAVDRYPTARFSLVQAEPLTGRRQQIRRHFKHISHHLIGDTTHGNGRQNRLFRERFGIHRLLLLSYRLRFVHPCTAAPIEVSAPFDADWQRIMTLFGDPTDRDRGG